ncbi:MAG: ABC transporter ATP-binding protein [Clostridia bacterium]|nr:ABC transporter ATP-binding protein [Clostridia bacterium]
MKDSTIISLKDINVSFDGEVIINNISLDIMDEEFITFLGPSGCGKTTTLRIIGGFLEPDSGDLFYEGNRINGTPPHKRNINTVFQKYALFPHLNVFDNVAFGLKLKKLPKAEIKKKVKYMLSVVDLKGYDKRSVSQLSGGQQQRVAIARALVCDPDVLLLDEPLGALDLKLRKDMQIELKRIQKMTKKTFVYVTHDQEEALTMSDRVVVMNNGVIEQIGTPTDIYNEPSNAFVADFIGEANILNATMIEDYKVNILGTEFKCTDAGFGKNTPVDVVIRPEDILVVPVENGIISGKVVNTVFKGVHYEMEVKCKNCTLLIHSTVSQSVGETIGMYVTPDNIHIMRKLFPTPYNEFEAVVSYSDEEENTTTIIIEGKEVEIKDRYFEKDAKLNIILPPTGIYIAGDGVGQIDDVYIESVIWKGEYNEIIVESDERKWLMHSAQDEQVATYAPICFDFKDAVITLKDDAEGENEV